MDTETLTVIAIALFTLTCALITKGATRNGVYNKKNAFSITTVLTCMIIFVAFVAQFSMHS